jgi:putrescine transport system permease protein
MAQLDNRTGRRLVAGIPVFWLLLFFFIPFIIVLKISFSEVRLAVPPYAPLFQWVRGLPIPRLHFGNYGFLFTDPLYISSYLYSLRVALVSTACCLLIGYPMAYAIAHSNATWRNVLLMMIILPFWTSFLLRVYAWIGLLKNNGVINNVLIYLGVIHEPLTLLQSDFAVYIGIVYSYLPFMILPLYANLEKHDNTLLEAAARDSIPADHIAAVGAGNHCRIAPGVYSRRGRIRCSLAPWAYGPAHDRASTVG